MAYVVLHRIATIDFTETSGKSVRRTYRSNPAVVTTDAAWLTAVQDLVAELALLSQSTIFRYQVSTEYADTGLSLPVSAENSNQALISGKILSDPSESAILSIPAIDPAYMVAPSGPSFDVVDVANGDVDAFLENFESGGNCTVSDGELVNGGTWAGRRRNTHSLGT